MLAGELPRGRMTKRKRGSCYRAICMASTAISLKSLTSLFLPFACLPTFNSIYRRQSKYTAFHSPPGRYCHHVIRACNRLPGGEPKRFVFTKMLGKPMNFRLTFLFCFKLSSTRHFYLNKNYFG